MADSDESSEDDTLSYLTAAKILPGLEHLRLTLRAGSLPRKRANIARNFDAAMNRLLTEYIGSAPKYREDKFARRFRMSRNVSDGVFGCPKPRLCERFIL
eukprot:gb/GEZJ01005684.1/.p1 GENE.gb/GEZJ01005684.1/~~gb/GEZJ01005684.1/.p1  ORF type:complete len:100 (-),score=6.98 gb/GEZJ01005684.1/:161-460(-)